MANDLADAVVAADISPRAVRFTKFNAHLNGPRFAARITPCVSDAFEGIRSLKRHQMVYAAIGDDMQKVHALSINARSPSEPMA